MKLLLYQSVFTLSLSLSPLVVLPREKNISGWYLRSLPVFPSCPSSRIAKHADRAFRASGRRSYARDRTRLSRSSRGCQATTSRLRGVSLYTGGLHTRWLLGYQRFLQRLRTEFRCSDGRTSPSALPTPARSLVLS